MKDRGVVPFLPVHIIFIIALRSYRSICLAKGILFARTYIETGGGINLSYFDVGGGSPGLSIGGSVLFDLHPQWRLGPNVGIPPYKWELMKGHPMPAGIMPIEVISRKYP